MRQSDFRKCSAASFDSKTQSFVSILRVFICCRADARETTSPNYFPDQATRDCLTEVRRMFDYIIIDAPPLGIFTDANVLMSRADGGLLVVRAGKTRYASGRQVAGADAARIVCWAWCSIAPKSNRIESSYYYQHRYYNRERSTTEMSRFRRPKELKRRWQ